MKWLLLSLPALAALAEASTVYGCAGSCIGQGIEATGCSSADSNCICSSDVFMSTIDTCVLNDCNVQEHESAVSLAHEFCMKIELAKREAEPEAEAEAKKNLHKHEQLEEFKEWQKTGKGSFREWEKKMEKKNPWWSPRSFADLSAAFERHHKKQTPHKHPWRYQKHHPTTTVPHHHTHTRPHTHHHSPTNTVIPPPYYGGRN